MRYITVISICSSISIFTTKVLLHVPQEIFKFFGTSCPTEKLWFRDCKFRCTCLNRSVCYCPFQNGNGSSIACNRSLDSAIREMYKLLTFSSLSVASFNQSMIERSLPFSTCPIKVSRCINHSRIASMTLGCMTWNQLGFDTIYYKVKFFTPKVSPIR